MLHLIVGMGEEGCVFWVFFPSLFFFNKKFLTKHNIDQKTSLVCCIAWDLLGMYYITYTLYVVVVAMLLWNSESNENVKNWNA